MANAGRDVPNPSNVPNRSISTIRRGVDIEAVIVAKKEKAVVTTFPFVMTGRTGQISADDAFGFRAFFVFFLEIGNHGLGREHESRD